MQQSHTLTFENITIDVDGDYTPHRHNGWETPPDYEEFDISTVKYKGVEISDLIEEINPDFFEKITIKIFEKQ